MRTHTIGALLLATACLAVWSAAGESTTLTVRQDGTGDFTTIAGAIAAASSGDTISVGAGTYAELLMPAKPLTFFGAGADATILDGEGSRQIMVFAAGSSGSIVAGFAFRNAYGGNGGALRVQDGCDVALRACAFSNNEATYDGAAFFVRHAGSCLLLEDCTFEGNRSVHNGGAGNIIEGGSLEVRRCVFRGNSTNVLSGALAAHYSVMQVSDCLFVSNASSDVAGAVYFYRSAGSVRGCTFDRNAATGEKAGTVFVQESESVTCERNITSNTQSGVGLYPYYCAPVHTCNLYWQNAGGAIGGGVGGGIGEIEADPLYCDAAAGNYAIEYGSPAAPPHNICAALFGAFAPACGVEPPPHVCARLTVRQDGTGAFGDIASALAAAVSCDTIDVGPGTYPESLDVAKSVVFVGAGAGSTVLDGEGTRALMVFRLGSSGASVSGCSFVNAHGANGGALRVQDGCDIAVRECSFSNNFAEYDGAAFFVRHSGSHLLLEDCVFEGNYSGHNGGAGNIIESGLLEVSRCIFRNNGTDVLSGALAAHLATMNVGDCLFSWNGSADAIGAVYYYESAGFVRGCTFDRNAASGINAATVLIQSSAPVTFERNIVSNTRVGAGLSAILCSPVHTCNLFWNNSGGSWIGDVSIGVGELEADPLYCDDEAGNYAVAYESPAAPANNVCAALFGAFAPACDFEPPPPHVCTRLTVRQDGSGDFTSVSDALAAALGCDTIDVGPGTYREVLDVTKGVVFVGAGAASTVFDGEETHTIMTFRYGSSGASVQGCTFVNAHGSNGGALRVQDGCDIAVRECAFVNNVAEYDGAAFYVRHDHSHLLLERCTFDGNHSIHNGGAGNIIENGLLEVDDCVFRNNSTDVVSGALASHTAEMRVTRSLFVGNASGDVAGAVYFYYSRGYAQSCTFDGNAAPGLKAGTVFVHESPGVSVERCIIANAPSGVGLWDGEWSFGSHSCNLFYANADGEVGGGTALDSTETIGDPFFCDPSAGDYRIAFESPAAPEYNPCGVIIGAYSRGCHEEPIAALLQRFEAKRRDWAIVVSWSVLAGAGEPSFSIERAVDGSGYEPLPNASIEREGADYTFEDGSVEPGKSYRYRVSCSLDEKSGQLFETELIAVPQMPLTLFQNFPNPFNPSTTIRFYLPEVSKVVLEVYDVSGRLIASLLDARCAAGMHVVEWTGGEARGGPAASGIYFYRLKTDAGVLSRKMILLR